MLLLPVAFAAIALCGKAVATASAITCCCMPRLYVVAVALCNCYMLSLCLQRVMPLPFIVAF
jgi:hypothetical protein